MISRRITRKPANDNYRRLAAYIAGAGHGEHGGEKCLLAWCAGCWAGDDYDLAVKEVADTQALNTRTTREKTYHLMVSFRPEDEAKLTPETFKAIEEAFATALGFEQHQRHCGVHKNTANLHMHVAYNMIHPERLTRHEPFRDFHTRDRVCRELEQRFGLSVDNGRERVPCEQSRLRDTAATVEAHTGQQSFEGYAKGHRATILEALDMCETWEDLHRSLAPLGLEVKPCANGLVCKDRHGERAIKASALDRSLSKPRLEQRFGPYMAPSSVVLQTQSRQRFQARPLHRNPERGNLYAAYKAGIERRKAALERIAATRRKGREALAQQWAQRREEIEAMPLTRRDRFNLLGLARQHEAQARRALARELDARRQEVNTATPFNSWSAFLRMQAEQGSEVALAILRSRKEETTPDKPRSLPLAPQKQLTPQTWHERQLEIRKAEALHPMERKELAAVARMRALVATEAAKLVLQVPLASQDASSTPNTPDAAATRDNPIKDFSYYVDGKGTVLFTLANGGRVVDAGLNVYFSPHNKKAEMIARRYAQKKWGKGFAVHENGLRFRDNERDQGMGRI